MYEQNRNICNEIETFFKKQKEVLKLKITIIEMKYVLERLSRENELANLKIVKMEIIKFKEQKF